MMYQSIIFIVYNPNLKEFDLLSIYIITETEHYFLLTSDTCTKCTMYIIIVTVYSYPNYTDD